MKFLWYSAFNFQKKIKPDGEGFISIKFLPLTFLVEFEREIHIRGFLTFAFRSILGRSLKKIFCIQRQKVCSECVLNKRCGYSVIFESPLEKENPLLPGINKKPHPYTIFFSSKRGEIVKSGNLHITLIGDEAISFTPYIYFALKNAGENGIFKERIRFKIKDVKIPERSIFISENKIDTNFTPLEFDLKSSENQHIKHLKIELLTPLRLKIDKKLKKDLTYHDLLKGAINRLNLLSAFYGNKGFNLNFKGDGKIFFERYELSGKSHFYYSSRQGQKLILSGVTGVMEVKKEFSEREFSILKGAETFGIGKSTSFGFGRIKINLSEV